MKVAVLGAGGFIGGHMVKRLLREGHDVRAVDLRPIGEWEQVHKTNNSILDCSDQWEAHVAVGGCDQVYLLAADMGGMGFIETNKLACMMNVLITTNVLKACDTLGVDRVFYASSACVYPDRLQTDLGSESLIDGSYRLAECMAYPAMPEDGYGWEKLYGERLCRHFTEETGLETRVARYHNIYGPHSAWRGGREKAPAALCRKVALVAVAEDYHIGIWGDGSQYRSYTYIDDCIEGTLRLMASDCSDPVNIGSSEGVTTDELVTIIEKAAKVPPLARRYDLSAPKGVAGRNSDNTLCREVLGWEPSTSLEAGIKRTYAWVYKQVKAAR
jgi:nucleoside-diphosphate-sugar epimerase